MEYRMIGNTWYSLPTEQVKIFDYCVQRLFYLPTWHLGLATLTFQATYERFELPKGIL